MIFVGSDILEIDDVDLRGQTFLERRILLEQFIGDLGQQNSLALSNVFNINSWKDISLILPDCRNCGARGVILKNKQSKYLTKEVSQSA